RRVGSTQAAGQLVTAVLGAQVVPSAVEVDDAGGVIDVAVLLEGVPSGVAGRVAAISALLGEDAGVSDSPPPWWGTYPWGAGDVGVKLTAALSRVPLLLEAARAARERYDVGLRVCGSAGSRGRWAGVRGGAEREVAAGVVGELRAAAGAAGGHAVVLTAPAAVRQRVDLWGPVDGLALMRRVKQRFDPDARLAPGRFVGGI